MMLSRDNQKETFKKSASRRQHYAIKKLTVGVSSVLIGLSFLGVQVQNVSANTETTPVMSTMQVESNNDLSNNDSSSEAPQITPAATTQDKLVTVANSAAEREKLDQNLPAISTNNPNAGAAAKLAGDHIITGLPNAAQYNLSVTAKNDSTSGSQAGKTSGIYLPEGDTTSHALINYRTAKDLQINFDLSNPTDQEMQIAPVIYLNPYGPYHNVVNPSLLRFGGRGEIVDQNGQVIDSLQVVFGFSGNQQYYTYDELAARGLSVGQADTFKIVGNLAANTTAHIVLPLTFDAENIGSYLATSSSVSNEIWLLGVNNVGTIALNLSAPLWQQSDVTNDDILPMLKTGESLYQVLPAHEAAVLQVVMEKAGAAVTNVVNVGNVDSSSNSNDPILWLNGTYQIKLDQIQNALRQVGYTVNLTPDNQGFMEYYSYGTMPMQGVQRTDGSLDTSTHYGFYIEVHPVLTTKDTELSLGSAQVDNWQPTDNIAAVNNYAYQGSDSTGSVFTRTPVSPRQVQVVKIVNQNGDIVSTINPDAPGTYTITYEYNLNGNHDQAFRFTNTAQVNVVQTTTPVIPVDPTPGEIIDPNEVRHNDGNGDQGNKGGNNTNANNNPVSLANHGGNWQSLNRPAASQQPAAVYTKSIGSNRQTVATQTKTNRLPQTGNASSAATGLGIASLLTMLGLAGVRRSDQ